MLGGAAQRAARRRLAEPAPSDPLSHEARLRRIIDAPAGNVHGRYTGDLTDPSASTQNVLGFGGVKDWSLSPETRANIGVSRRKTLDDGSPNPNYGKRINRLPQEE